MPWENHESSPDLRRVLRDRQRARNRISCLPCRERKVKCSREHPCATCIKRDHPDLCIYSAPPLPAPSPVTNTGAPGPVPEARSGIGHDAQTSAAMHAHSGDDTGGPSSPTPQASPSGIPLLGGSSLLAIAREHSSHTYHGTDGGGDDDDDGDDDDGGRGDALKNAVIPLLGVAHSDHGSRSGKPQNDDLYTNLPDNQELLNLFFIYRTRVHPFQLILCNLDDVESELCDIVNQRAGSTRSRGAGTTLDEVASERRRHFLCLVHAMLAAGAQFSDLPPNDRNSVSRRHSALPPPPPPSTSLPLHFPFL